MRILQLAHAPPAHDSEVEQQEQGQRVQEQCQCRLPPGGLHHLSAYYDPLALKQRKQVGITRCRHKCGELTRCRRSLLADGGFEGACDRIVALDGYAAHIALLHLLQEAAVRQINRCRLPTRGTEEEWTVKEQVDQEYEQKPPHPEVQSPGVVSST